MNYPLFKIGKKNFNSWYEEWMAQYPHSKPYSGLALPQLGLGGQSQAPVTQGDPFRAPKQPAIHPNHGDILMLGHLFYKHGKQSKIQGF